MREAARIYGVRMAQFVLKIENLSQIMDPRGSQDLLSPSPIMAPDSCLKYKTLVCKKNCIDILFLLASYLTISTFSRKITSFQEFIQYN